MRKKKGHAMHGLFQLAGSTGLEPAASGVTGRRYNQLNYDPKLVCSCIWWAKRGSNPRHPACKAGALPAELFALIVGGVDGARTRGLRRDRPAL